MLGRLKITVREARLELIELFGCFRSPIVISFGAGVDSMAVLVGLKNRGIRPDLIKFADTKGEKRSTYAYIPIADMWCRENGFPGITIVEANSKYKSLYDECWQKSMLPSIAYGGHSCSDKWKQAALVRYSNNWRPAQLAWACGLKMIRVIGYDASARDCARREKAVTYVAKKGDHKHQYWYPLQDWNWDRDECKRQILSEGLPLPPKSSCTFCTAMKEWEIRELRREEPDTYYANIALEQRAVESGKLERNARGELKVKGLGRSYSWSALEEKFLAEERRETAGLVSLVSSDEFRLMPC